MKRTRKSWRIVAAAFALVLVLASTPAVAQPMTASAHVGPGSWIEWVVAQVGNFWQLVAAVNVGTDDGGGQLPDPKG